MLPPKTEDIEDYILPHPLHVHAELDLWTQLSFSFEMDNRPPKKQNDPRYQIPNRSRSGSAPSTSQTDPSLSDAQDAALLAQFAAATSSSHQGHAPHPFLPAAFPPMTPHTSGSFPDNFLLSNQMEQHHQLPPLSSLDFPWPFHAHAPQHNQPQHDSTSSFPFHPSFQSLPPPPHMVAGPSHQSASPEASSPVTDTPAEGDQSAIAEEKRRRNTAASARFRIKKKQKTTNLERSVSDLTGRAEELEREAADLRRENGWLKEIVMLKGSRIASSSLVQGPPPTQLSAGNYNTRDPRSSKDQEESESEGVSSEEGRQKAKRKPKTKEPLEKEKEKDKDKDKAKGKGKGKEKDQ